MSETKVISYDNLLEVGFEPCIFAPIYIGRYCFYLGSVDWETKNFSKCTMMLAERADGKWQDDFQRGDRTLMSSIKDVLSYCIDNKITMSGSTSPYRKKPTS